MNLGPGMLVDTGFQYCFHLQSTSSFLKEPTTPPNPSFFGFKLSSIPNPPARDRISALLLKSSSCQFSEKNKYPSRPIKVDLCKVKFPFKDNTQYMTVAYDKHAIWF